MSQTDQLIKALKRCLRAKGLTYRDLAVQLGLSESSVKRLFSERTFTVQRLEEICRHLEMSLYDLSRIAASREDDPGSYLSKEQEAALVADPVLLSYFYLLMVGWAPHKIGSRLKLDIRGRKDYLHRLAALKLIEVLPQNRARLLTDTRVSWRPSGPIRRRYESQVKQQFVDHEFDGPDDALSLEVNELSDASIKILLRRIGRLGDEFSDLAELDRSLPHERKRSFGVFIGARQWTFWNTIGELPGRD